MVCAQNYQINNFLWANVCFERYGKKNVTQEFLSVMKLWCTRVMPLPPIFVSDTFPILPPAIIFFNQRQRQNGTPRK